MEHTYRVSTRHNAQGHEKGAAFILAIGFIYQGLRTIISSDGGDHQTARETILVPHCFISAYSLRPILDQSLSPGK